MWKNFKISPCCRISVNKRNEENRKLASDKYHSYDYCRKNYWWIQKLRGKIIFA